MCVSHCINRVSTKTINLLYAYHWEDSWCFLDKINTECGIKINQKLNPNTSKLLVDMINLLKAKCVLNIKQEDTEGHDLLT